jgi:hypothetical protein
MSMKTPLELMGSTIAQFVRAWPEGRREIAILGDWVKLGLRIFNNLIEENHLWEGPDPTGYQASKRRTGIFSENRRLGEEANKKLIEGLRRFMNLQVSIF